MEIPRLKPNLMMIACFQHSIMWVNTCGDYMISSSDAVVSLINIDSIYYAETHMWITHTSKRKHWNAWILSFCFQRNVYPMGCHVKLKIG